MATDTQSEIDRSLQILGDLLAAARAHRIDDCAEGLEQMDGCLAQLKIIMDPSDEQVQQLRQITESYRLLQLMLVQKTDELSRRLAGTMRGQTGLNAYRSATDMGTWRGS